MVTRQEPDILWFKDVTLQDVGRVGGKNASLGEMVNSLQQAGVRVPDGFATTAAAYRRFLEENNLVERITSHLNAIDPGSEQSLQEHAGAIRQLIEAAPLPTSLAHAVTDAYRQLTDSRSSVAVRSSATAEDLPGASFAGQQETYLNVRGIESLLKSLNKAFASLFTERAIAYRAERGFDHMKVALSAGIQKMVRSDLAASGVAFTLDTESGFDQVVLVSSTYGLGETLVQGMVNPDEFVVYKPALTGDAVSAILSRTLGNKAIKLVYDAEGTTSSVHQVEVTPEDRNRFSLTDKEVAHLARQCLQIESHYGMAMDIEWAKDGDDGQIYIVQARPETVQSRADRQHLERYRMKTSLKPLTTGQAVGKKIGTGRACLIRDVEDLDRLAEGDVLVAERTLPDWGPAMKRAAAIVTDSGGRACHAAIVAREMGIPAVVGCGDATQQIPNGSTITVSCASGVIGKVYVGALEFDVQTVAVAEIPEIPVKIMMNLANPHEAFNWAQLPNAGVGLARTEFIINEMIGIHPKAALEFSSLDAETREAIQARIAGYPDPVSYYVSRLSEGVALLAAAFAPKPVIVRLSDFKSNEYAHLLGGEHFEPVEDNPMLGFRGVARYLSEAFASSFVLECRAIKRVRDDIGLKNVEVMLPFLRTLEEAKRVTALLEENGLKRGEDGLRLIMMCEIPSNALLAEQFLEYFDGFSIGSNDLTQLTLGVDRDSDLLADLFDERDPAVKLLISQAIKACHSQGRYVGICGQGPSDHPDLAAWLVQEGIDSLSLNPDVVLETWMSIAGMSRQ